MPKQFYVLSLVTDDALLMFESYDSYNPLNHKSSQVVYNLKIYGALTMLNAHWAMHKSNIVLGFKLVQLYASNHGNQKRS